MTDDRDSPAEPERPADRDPAGERSRPDDADERPGPHVEPDRTDSDGDDGSVSGGRVPIDLERNVTTETDEGERTAEDGVMADDRGRPADAEDQDDDTYRPEPSSTPIEAGSPTLEHAVFVVLGALAMVAVVLRISAVAV